MNPVATSDALCVLNPVANRFGGDAQHLSPRPASLEGRTIGLLWNGKANGDWVSFQSSFACRR